MNKASIIIIYKDFSIFWLDLLKKMNIKHIGLHSIYQYGGLKSYLSWLETRETQELIKTFENEGFDFVHQLHAIDYLLPRELFNEHPDWFRENKDHIRVNDWNLCASNEKALHFIEDSSFNLASRLKQKSHDYDIWPDDCLDSICHCEKCSKLSAADQNIIISSHVLKGLKRYDKEAKLSFLAYQDSLEIPTLKPEKDMFLEFAPIDRNHHVSLNGTDPSNIKNKETFEKLIKIFTNEVHVLEYYLDVSYFCKWIKENAGPLEVNENVLVDDFAYYKSCGTTNLATFAGFINQEWIEKYGDAELVKYSNVINAQFVSE